MLFWNFLLHWQCKFCKNSYMWFADVENVNSVKILCLQTRQPTTPELQEHWWLNYRSGPIINNCVFSLLFSKYLLARRILFKEATIPFKLAIWRSDVVRRKSIKSYCIVLCIGICRKPTCCWTHFRLCSLRFESNSQGKSVSWKSGWVNVVLLSRVYYSFSVWKSATSQNQLKHWE